MKTIVYQIDHPGEHSAGFVGYTDTVTIIIESGNAGGELGEFEEAMRKYLSEWYDGATVKLEATHA